MPHFDVCKCIPYDMMHVELEGLLKNELAAMLFYFVRKRDWGFTLTALNERLNSYAWPGNYRPPTFTSGALEVGTKDGKCKKGCHVHMTAGDMLVFARHSIDVMLPLIKDPQDPCWQAWILHVSYVRLLMQHEISDEEVQQLDELIYLHQEAFLDHDKEYGSRLWKPKNHFASHFPTDILNFGPVRNYWCMRFEALNLMMKLFAASGTFRNVCGRVADMWTVRLAHERDKCTKGTRSAAQNLDLHPVARTYWSGTPSAWADPTIMALFTQSPRLPSITLTWVSRLLFLGSEYVAGASWIAFDHADKSSRMLGYIPKHAIFEIDGRYYMLIHTYPHGVDVAFKLTSTTVLDSYVAPKFLVCLDSPKVSKVTPLWPSFYQHTAGKAVYRFVPLL